MMQRYYAVRDYYKILPRHVAYGDIPGKGGAFIAANNPMPGDPSEYKEIPEYLSPHDVGGALAIQKASRQLYPHKEPIDGDIHSVLDGSHAQTDDIGPWRNQFIAGTHLQGNPSPLASNIIKQFQPRPYVKYKAARNQEINAFNRFDSTPRYQDVMVLEENTEHLDGVRHIFYNPFPISIEEIPEFKYSKQPENSYHIVKCAFAYDRYDIQFGDTKIDGYRGTFFSGVKSMEKLQEYRDDQGLGMTMRKHAALSTRKHIRDSN